MQIHELTNTADLSSTDYVGVDNGTTTRRFDLGALIASIRNRLTNAETGITNLQTSVSDVQGDVADVQSDITGLGTRLDAAESSITSQGTRLTAAESTISSQGTRLTTAESNITSLQNNKVDKTTPLINFDDTATDPLTDDGALANALTALGILSDVIPAGGGMLYLKKALTELAERFGSESTSLSKVSTKLSRGDAWLVYDKASKTCRINFHFTANANTTLALSDILFTVPQKYRPDGNYSGMLIATTSANIIASYYVKIDSSGNITQQLGATVTAGAGYIEYPL